MRVTIYGFYQYDSTLFDDVMLPSGLDKDLLIRTIMRKSGDLYSYYQQPEELKQNITDWFAAMNENFKRMYAVLTEEYDPIHNFYRQKHNFEQNYGKVKSEASGETHRGQSEENFVNSFDSSTYKKDNKSEGKENANSKNEVETNTQDALTIDSTESGNIGNIKTTDFINDELKLRTYNLYNKIASMFEEEFLVRIY